MSRPAPSIVVRWAALLVGGLVAVLTGVGALLAATAPPAAAHAGPGGVTVPPSNDETVVRGLEPPLPGVTVSARPGSGALTLENTSGRTLTVLGYNDEPYLRIGPDGVFVNEASPATYLNEDLTGGSAVPASARPDAEPVWRRTGDGPSATWHDHRTHWMQPYDPPEVLAAPDVDHVVVPGWAVPVTLAGADSAAPTTATISGDVVYVAPAPAWPWLALVVALAAGIGTAAVGPRWRSALLTGAALLVAATVADLVGMFGVVPGAPTTLGVALSALLLVGLVTGAALVARGAPSGLIVLGVAATAAGMLVGFTGRATLTASRPASALAPAAAQLVVAVALGAAIGVVGAVVVRQQRGLAALASPPDR